MDTITIKAYAKINLGLEILIKRQDGYHNINSAITRISLADTLSIRKNKKILVNTSPQINIPMEQNLVYRAAKLIKESFNVESGAEILIEKNIPMGAGLGGGSSDAAATIKGLLNLWDIQGKKGNEDWGLGDIASAGDAPDAVMQLSSSLGTDVPYFLKDGTAIASERGEVLDYFNSGLNFWVLIVIPDISISTKWAYEHLNENHFSKVKTDFKYTLEEVKTNKSILKEKVFNNFELLIFGHYPGIGKIKNELYDCGAVFALMSGSGASVYGLFDTKEEAQIASLKFSKYKNFVCELIQ
ncbi:MAG: 4-(cytidine 5'-diphospho)-2-C-methyl-D-erythritol kinase [Bacteroidetes bacterium]|nr:4-(cytidine 5'-diphospho)-2-C-methyl-D-erythritol kinase [Bacteroidota bacterium]